MTSPHLRDNQEKHNNYNRSQSKHTEHIYELTKSKRLADETMTTGMKWLCKADEGMETGMYCM